MRYWHQALRLLAAGLLLPGSLGAQGVLYNHGGAQLVLSGEVHLVLRDAALANNGVLAAGAGSSVHFTGRAPMEHSIIAGKEPVAFHHLVMNKERGGLQLERSIAVAGELRLLDGDSLFLNGHDIDLGRTGSLMGESAERRITGPRGGHIRVERDLRAPAAVNPGAIGLELTSGAQLGRTVVWRGHEPQGADGIGRYFVVLAEHNSELDAMVRFRYWPQELNGQAEERLALYGAPAAGGSWTVLGRSDQDLAAHWVSHRGLGALHRLTLAPLGAVLPVELLSFDGRLRGGRTELSWVVAHERDCARFEVERSADGRRFTKLGEVAGRGDQAAPELYRYTDAVPLVGANYYRLRQVDFDGQFSYSPVVRVQVGAAAGGALRAYPNPVESCGRVRLVFALTEDRGLPALLMDLSGRVLQRRAVWGRAGHNELHWDMSALAAGTYTVWLQGVGAVVVQKR